MNRRLNILSVLAVCFVGSAVLARYAFERHVEWLCHENLRNIREVMGLYLNTPNSTWPSSLTQLLKEEDAETLEASPAVGKEGQVDYFYIDWQSARDGPKWGVGRFPVIYDRRLSNHNGRGIYILLTDGEVIWDPGATWLRQFAAQHPQNVVPISN